MSFSVTLNISIKHHIAQLIKTKYGHPFIFSKDNPYSNIFKRMLTDNKEDKLIEFPENYDTLQLHCTGQKVFMYVSQSVYNKEMSLLEKFYWSQIKAEIYEDFVFTRNMSESIRSVYDRYNIDEELYDMDNFRRQITRIGVRNNVEYVKTKKQHFTKITPDEGIQIAKDYYIRGITLKQISEAYGISHMTAKRVKDLYKNKIISMSKNVTYLLRRIKRIDDFNFNRCSSNRNVLLS